MAKTPFDARLNRNIHSHGAPILNIDGSINTTEISSEYHEWYETPFTNEQGDYNINDYFMIESQMRAKGLRENMPNDSSLERVFNSSLENIEQRKLTGKYSTTPSIMNPYAHTRLYGAKGAEFVVDDATRRKYYEEGTDDGHYASNPTTSNIIKWGSLDVYGRTPYQYQDFVFCKHWNRIPNNRLITLRRYAAPVSDNLAFDFQLEASQAKKKGEKEAIVGKTMHPIATALTYFGDGTDNKLSDLLKFSAYANWEQVESDIWEVSGNSPSTERLEAATKVFGGWGKIFGDGLSSMSTVMALFGENKNGDSYQFDFRANQGLPPDPYKNGPYNNQVLGPMNCIRKTYKRKRGLEFTNEISLKFHYTARPIGGINNKAVLLDILSNLLVMAYSSGVWWGGSHRFRIEPHTYPYTCSEARKKFWEGKLLGKDGAIHTQMQYYKDTISDKGPLQGNTSLKGLFEATVASIGTIARDLLDSMNFNSDSVTGLLNELIGNTSEESQGIGKVVSERLQKMVGSSMQKQIGHIQYMDGMKAILSGEPVGDWHLTIGNPMNPIVEIGNLVCKNIEITWDDELGPDDFPIGFTATIKLDHGSPRDRDGIEAMYNKGAGRIYVLPDKYVSSADGQSKIDKTTGKKMKGVYSAGPQNAHTAAINYHSTAGYCDNIELKKQRDAYKDTALSDFEKLTLNRIPSTLSVVDLMQSNNMDSIVHYMMPWQTHIVM